MTNSQEDYTLKPGLQTPVFIEGRKALTDPSRLLVLNNNPPQPPRIFKLKTTQCTEPSLEIQGQLTWDGVDEVF